MVIVLAWFAGHKIPAVENLGVAGVSYFLFLWLSLLVWLCVSLVAVSFFSSASYILWVGIKNKVMCVYINDNFIATRRDRFHRQRYPNPRQLPAVAPSSNAPTGAQSRLEYSA
jgi:hypothetical protein